MKLKKNNFIAKLLKQSVVRAKEYNAKDYGLYPSDFGRAVLSVVETLKENGYEAYIVGGGVRDQILDLHPKDFDVATNARPEEIKKCFQRALIIGKRFRLVHVYFNRRDYIEVATFRAGHQHAQHENDARTKKGGIIARDNVYGTLEEDAFRRDFTINALYYDPIRGKLLDYCEGVPDLKAKILRLIGKPHVRFKEDPVRILRALRFANKLGFTIEEKTLHGMKQDLWMLKEISGGRLFDEYTKVMLYGQAYKNFYTLHEFKILEYFFPYTLACWQQNWFVEMINLALENTDERFYQNKTIHPAFLIAVFLYAPLLENFRALSRHMSKKQAFLQALEDTLKAQVKHTTMPNFFSQMVRDVWSLQRLLELRRKNKVLEILKHPRFRAAYDFLLLRTDAGQVNQGIAEFWTEVQILEETELLARFAVPEKLKKNIDNPQE
jgi:poly(A) polymerase